MLQRLWEVECLSRGILIYSALALHPTPPPPAFCKFLTSVPYKVSQGQREGVLSNALNGINGPMVATV